MLSLIRNNGPVVATALAALPAPDSVAPPYSNKPPESIKAAAIDTAAPPPVGYTRFGTPLLTKATSAERPEEPTLLADLKSGKTKLADLPESEREKESNILAAIDHDWQQLGTVDQARFKNKDFMTKAVAADGRTLKYADDELKNDKDLVRNAVKYRDEAFQYASKTLQKDKEYVRSLCVRETDSGSTIQPGVFQFADKSFRKDEKFAVELLKKNCDIYEFLDKDVRYKPAIADLALNVNGRNLQFAPPEYSQNREKVLQAMSKWGTGLKYASPQLKADRELNLLAGKKGNFQDIHESFSKDKKFLLEVYESNNRVYAVFPDELKINKRYALEYLSQYPFYGLTGIPEKLANDVNFVATAVQRSKFLYHYLPQKLKENEKIILAAVSTNPTTIKDIPDTTLKNVALLDQIALTSLPSRKELESKVGKLPSSTIANYEKLKDAYQVLGLNAEGFARGKEGNVHRFDNSRAVIEGRYQVESRVTKQDLEKILGKDYFKNVPALEKDTRRSAIVIFSAEDGNSGTAQDDGIFFPRDSVDNLTCSHRTAVYEVKTKEEVKNAWNQATQYRQYKLSTAFLNAHGAPGLAHLAGDNFITAGDRKFFATFMVGSMTEDSMFLMGSCKTGADSKNGNLAKVFADLNPSATVYAPKENCNFTWSMDGSGSPMAPEYVGERTGPLKADQVFIRPAYRPVTPNLNSKVDEDKAALRIIDAFTKDGGFLGQGVVSVYSRDKGGFIDEEGFHLFYDGELVSRHQRSDRGTKEIVNSCVAAQAKRVVGTKTMADILKNFEATKTEDLKPLKDELAKCLGYSDPVKLHLQRGTNVWTLQVYDTKDKLLAKIINLDGSIVADVNLGALTQTR